MHTILDVVNLVLGTFVIAFTIYLELQIRRLQRTMPLLPDRLRWYRRIAVVISAALVVLMALRYTR